MSVLEGLYAVAIPSVNGDYVVSINGVAADEHHGWVYFVNGNMPPMPASAQPFYQVL